MEARRREEMKLKKTFGVLGEVHVSALNVDVEKALL